MIIVKKFGGTSVADKEKIYRAIKRCVEDYKNGYDVVVVLSAMGKYTDELIDMAKQFHETPPKREMDMLYTIGEQMSVSLMAMAFHNLGIPAVSLNAFQVPMITTSVYGSARIKEIKTERIKNELEQKKIVIVTGFQGIDEYNNYTTLGRGGSDTTAVALAASLYAEKCEIYTDVDGVYTADPRKVPKARKLEEITYDEMLEFASLGAGVLHNRSVEMAKKYKVPLIVRSSISNEEGTIVKEEVKMEKMLVSGVTADKNIVNVNVVGIKDKGATFHLFHLLAKYHINVDVILQSEDTDCVNISFTINKDDEKETIDIIQNNFENYKDIKVQRELAKVSIVGAGMRTNAGVAAKMFEALYDEGIQIHMISTSEIRVSVLIEEEFTEKALNAISQKFSLIQN